MFGTESQYFAISCVDNRTISVLNKDSDVVKSYKSRDQLDIAGVTESHDIVVVNFPQGRIEVIDTESEEMKVLHKYDLPGITKAWDVVIDRAGDIWCFHGNDGKYQLTKLSRDH